MRVVLKKAKSQKTCLSGTQVKYKVLIKRKMSNDNLLEHMALYLAKSIQDAAEAKKALDEVLKAQKELDEVLKAQKELERVKAIPSPLERLGWARKTPSRTKRKLPPPVPGTEHKYTRSYDLYIMTPAYAEYLRRTEAPRTEAPDLEELD